jgi:pimeloyl-ACP methyl ester carboxylesterase
MLTATAPDGTEVRAWDEGEGPVILVVHPGLDDGTSWAKVSAKLAADKFRVVRIQRRQYRPDRPPDARCSIADEAADVLALARDLGGQLVIVGHSSGGIVALEALAASPATFAGAVLYEPPIVLRPPLGGVALTQARAAISAGKPGKAMQIFLRDVVGVPGWVAWLTRPAVALVPRLRAFAPRQVDDLAAINDLGDRREVYATIQTPTVLLGGENSPAHLRQRLEALHGLLPDSETVTLPHQGHQANTKAPGAVAEVIETLAHRVSR